MPVWVEPVTPDAKAQYDAVVRAGRMPHQQQYATNVSEYGPRAAH